MNAASRLELVAAGVVVESATEDHGIQELAAFLNFRERWIVFQGIWIDGLLAIQLLTVSLHLVGPGGHHVGFATQQLKGILIGLGGSSDARLTKGVQCLLAVSLHPCLADGQPVENHSADSYAPLSYGGQGGYSCG